jgi:phage terminase small subunit
MPALPNPRQEKFVQKYIIHLNGTKAATQAGYSKRTANEQASRLLANVSIQNRVAELQKEASDRNKVKADDVIGELKALAFWSINDFISDGNRVKDLSKQKRAINKPVIGIKTKTEYNEFGQTTTVELKLADKRAALVDLGRHLGIFKEDNDQKTIKIKVSRK